MCHYRNEKDRTQEMLWDNNDNKRKSPVGCMNKTRYSLLRRGELFRKTPSGIDQTLLSSTKHLSDFRDPIGSTFHTLTFIDPSATRKSAQLSSRWNLCARKKHIQLRAPPRLSKVSAELPLKQLQGSSD